MDDVNPGDAGPPPESRARLALKGEALYAKSCRTGRGACAEGFVVHQLRIGNEEVVRDFLRFLRARLADLEPNDPEGLRAMTEGLAGRIGEHLGGRR